MAKKINKIEDIILDNPEVLFYNFMPDGEVTRDEGELFDSLAKCGCNTEFYCTEADEAYYVVMRPNE